MLLPSTVNTLVAVPSTVNTIAAVAQMEKTKQKEIQAQHMEEQRQQFKLKTQNLLKFKMEDEDIKPARVGRKKKERSGDIFSEGEEGEDGQPVAKKRKCVRKKSI